MNKEFNEEYFKDIKKILDFSISLHSEYRENILKLCKLAFEISNANLLICREIEEEKTKNIYHFGDLFNLSEELILKGIDQKDKEVNSLEYEMILKENEFLDKNIKKYYRFTIKVHDNIIGYLYFFYNNEKAFVKRDRLLLIIQIIAREKEHILLNQIINEEKNKYVDFFEKMPYAIYFMRTCPEIEFFYANKKFVEMTGYSKEELYKKREIIGDVLIHPEDRKKYYDFIHSDEVFKKEIRIRWITKSGEEIWTERTFSPILNNDKKVIGVYAIVKNITSEMIYNKNITEYNKNIILMNQIDNIFIKNKGENIYSKIIEIILFLTSSKFGFVAFLNEEGNLKIKYISKEIENLFANGIINCDSVCAQTIKEGIIINKMDVVIPIKDMKFKNVLSIPLPYNNIIFGLIMLLERNNDYDENIILKISNIINHISDRLYTLIENDKLIEKENKMKEELLKNAKLESIDTFARGVAHDFNNILTGIYNNIAYLREEIKDKEMKKILSETENYAESAKNLAKKLMSFSKDLKPVKEIVDSYDFFHQTFNVLKKNKGVKVSLSIDKKLKNIEIDKNQIIQVLTNIFINSVYALKEIKEPKISISINSKVLENNEILTLNKGEYIEITIEDNGSGIKKENLIRIFEPYFTTKKEGSGFGLYLSRQIVKAHNGEILIFSEFDKWTMVKIYLPITALKVINNIDIKKEINLNKIPILILDDEEFVLKSLKRIILSFNGEVFTALDTKEAFNILNENEIKIVFIDLTLKEEKTGFDFNIEMKEKYPNIISIMTSGFSDEMNFSDYKDKKFDFILTKPYKIEDIKEVLLKATNYYS